MLIAAIVALAAVITAPTAPDSSRLPLGVTPIQIERERGGPCTEIRMGAPTVLTMKDVCHGWSMTSCFDQISVVGTGVVEDQAQVLFIEEQRVADLVPMVDRAIAKRWPGDAHLHLSFGAPTCEGKRLFLPFLGSHMKAGGTGSASGLIGAIVIERPDDTRTTVQPAPLP